MPFKRAGRDGLSVRTSRYFVIAQPEKGAADMAGDQQGQQQDQNPPQGDQDQGSGKQNQQQDPPEDWAYNTKVDGEWYKRPR